MASFILGTIKSQLPLLVEKSEPQIEAGLVSALQTMKTQHPAEAQLFLQNWKKLDSAVQRELAVSAGRRKRTLKRKANKRK
jgi:hypothetical protein